MLRDCQSTIHDTASPICYTQPPHHPKASHFDHPEVDHRQTIHQLSCMGHETGTKPMKLRDPGSGGFSGGPLCKTGCLPTRQRVIVIEKLMKLELNDSVSDKDVTVALCIRTELQEVVAQSVEQLDMKTSIQSRPANWPMNYESKNRWRRSPFSLRLCTRY